jgi:flagellar assembly protein FliH
MSDAAITPISFTDVARNRSAFTPMRGPSLCGGESMVVVDEYARGLADGEQIAAAAFDIERRALLELVASAQALKAEVGPELSLLLRETVFRLVQQIYGHANIDAGFLEEQIAAAVAVIAEADAARQIILHPEDAALVGESVHSLAVRSDPSLTRGMIRIDCSQGWIEHGVALGIERLRGMLGVST